MMLRRTESVSSVRFIPVVGVLAGVLLFAGCEKSTTDKDIETVSIADLKRLSSSAAKPGNESRVVILDPRSATDYAAGHIPGAVNLQLPDLMQGRTDSRLLGYETIIVYGDDPASPTARGLTKRLMSNGHKDVKLLEGGLKAWLRQGGDTRAIDGK